MGLFDRFKSALGTDAGENQEKSSDESGPFSAPPEEVLEDQVDIDRRSGIIAEYYDVTEAEATAIAECLNGHLSGAQSSSHFEMLEDVSSIVSLPTDSVEEMIMTESSSISNLRRARSYSQRSNSATYVYDWTGPSDHRTSQICIEAEKEIEEHGGALPLDDLQDLLRETAARYPDEGTPERMDHWVPHHKCRHVIVRHVE